MSSMFKKTVSHISILFLIIISIVVGGFVFYGGAEEAQAGTGQNTSGYAWSENIGWISFNSTNCDSNGDGITDAGNYPNCPIGQPIVSYGVHIDSASGDLSGFAWSENIGWISFNRSDAGNPPAAPFNGGSGPIAKYDSGTKTITGWMRVLSVCDSLPCASSGPGLNSGGWDGWIKFQSASIDSNGEWHGWDWSNMVVGWVSINSVEGGGVGYKVTSIGLTPANQPPTATNPHVHLALGPAATFDWTFSDPDSGDTQSAYQIQADDNSDFSSLVIDSGQVFSGSGSFFSGQGYLAYNTTYYWRLKVWDSLSADSGWIYPVPASFTTPSHASPVISDISWSPAKPAVGEEVDFDADTTCYQTGGGAISCPVSGFSWTFEHGTPATIDNDDTPVGIKFSTIGSSQITLTVTDSDGYQTTRTESLRCRLLPFWKEIAP